MNEELNNLLEIMFNDLDIYLEDYKLLTNDIMSDKELMSLINNYRDYKTISSKEKIFKNEKYNKYLKYERELLYLNLNMTNKLKDLIKGEEHECH